MNNLTVRNIYNNIPAIIKEEFFENLIETNEFKLERIVSEGNYSPPNYWYDQEKNEFVLLLTGSATLSFDDGTLIKLIPGDYLIIPAHKKHRVEETDKNQKTFWLALFY